MANIHQNLAALLPCRIAVVITDDQGRPPVGSAGLKISESLVGPKKIRKHVESRQLGDEVFAPHFQYPGRNTDVLVYHCFFNFLSRPVGKLDAKNALS